MNPFLPLITLIAFALTSIHCLGIPPKPVDRYSQDKDPRLKHVHPVTFKLGHRLKPNDKHHNATISQFHPVYLQPSKLDYIVRLDNPYEDSFYNATYLRLRVQDKKLLGLCNNRNTLVEIIHPETKKVIYATELHQSVRTRVYTIRADQKIFHLAVQKTTADVFIVESNYDDPPNAYVTLPPIMWSANPVYILTLSESTPVLEAL